MTEDVQRTLGRLEGKLDMVLEGMEALRETIKAHDGRITALEGWQGKILGGAAALGAIAGILVKVFLG